MQPEPQSLLVEMKILDPRFRETIEIGRRDRKQRGAGLLRSAVDLDQAKGLNGGITPPDPIPVEIDRSDDIFLMGDRRFSLRTVGNHLSPVGEPSQRQETGGGRYPQNRSIPLGEDHHVQHSLCNGAGCCRRATAHFDRTCGI